MDHLKHHKLWAQIIQTSIEFLEQLTAIVDPFFPTPPPKMTRK